jgi:hypothetical protein
MAVGHCRLYRDAMAYECHRPHFTVTVKSGFISQSQWAVHGVVEYLPDAPAERRQYIEAEARLELMIGIARESRRGGDKLAGNVLVLVEGDHDAAGLFSGSDRCLGTMQLA